MTGDLEAAKAKYLGQIIKRCCAGKVLDVKEDEKGIYLEVGFLHGSIDPVRLEDEFILADPEHDEL